MKKIKLTNCNLYTYFDDDDYDLINNFTWKLSRKGYAEACVKVKFREKYKVKGIQMQRLLMFDKLEKGLLVDHIDRNKLNNCKSNLRLVTMAQSNMNRGKINFKKKAKIYSKYKGVHYARNKWRASITVNGKHIYLGFFDNEKEAALAFNNAAIKYQGEYAYLNIID